MTTTFQVAVTLEVKTCGMCGGVYGLNDQFMDHARSHGNNGWHCPYCSQGWTIREPDVVRLRRELETKQRELTVAKCEILRAQQLRQDEEAAHEKTQRKLKRVDRGVCPCCNRSFQNLARHMATKHPKENAA